MRSRALRAVLTATLLSALLGGCAPLLRGPAPAPAAPPADFPEGYYREALAQGKPVFRVDPAESLVVIEVRRSGSLARLGHDHVVASREVVGYVAPDEGRADLYVALARMQVDEPALRAEAGFTTQPSEADIEGTRSNMLEKVLEADKFPFALVRVTGIRAATQGAPFEVALTLHGTSRSFEIVPESAAAEGARVALTGRLSFD